MVPLLWLRVRASNREVQAFYRDFGFSQRGRFSGYYTAPEEDAILMGLDLTA